MHIALYRKWRPLIFDDVVGQDAVTSVLKYEVAQGKISHAYLFCGSRGTGKTTCAKILAKAANCENPINGNPCIACPSCREIDSGRAVDILEMDAASNRGIDDIRAIKDDVNFSPATLKNRVYIIDEVHMLTQEAFNALLKTLEEPPENVIFILATTEAHKLPATIISRCQYFDFKRINTEIITKHLLNIANEEGILLTYEAAFQIARISQGGMRDAISLLELCNGSKQGGGEISSTIDIRTVEKIAGSTGRAILEQLVCAISKKEIGTIFEIIDEISSATKDIGVFWQELIEFYRDILVIKTVKSKKEYQNSNILDLTETELKTLIAIAENFSIETLLYQVKIIEEAYNFITRGIESKRSRAEITLVRLCMPPIEEKENIEALTQRIISLENIIKSKLQATFTTTPPVQQPQQFTQAIQPQPQTTPVKTSKTELQNTIPYWKNILEKLPNSLVACIEESSPYKEGNTFIIPISDESTFAFINTKENENQLLILISEKDPQVKIIKFLPPKPEKSVQIAIL